VSADMFSRFMHRFLAATALTLAASAALAQSDGKPSLLQQYGDWGVYTGTAGGNKVCFAVAQPTSSQTNPPNRPRDPVYFYIATRPAEGVRNEVNIIIGYPFAARADASIEVGTAKFALQTQSDNGWAKSQSDENQMVDAMRRGADMVVKGQSGRGTQTTDRFSLRGLGQALDRAGQECR
jgi:invasion protein IalB